MKKTQIILTFFLAAVTGSIYGQGQLVLDNLGNSSANPYATANGLFWTSTGGAPALIRQDFNAAFYGGTDSGSLTLLATILLSDGSGAGDNAGGPGTFAEPSGKFYTFPGASSSVFMQIEAWTGNFSSYTAALGAGAPAAQSPVFINPVSVPPGFAPDLVGMPAMVMSIPEPSTSGLAAFGSLCLFLLGRRKLR